MCDDRTDINNLLAVTEVAESQNMHMWEVGKLPFRALHELVQRGCCGRDIIEVRIAFFRELRVRHSYNMSNDGREAYSHGEEEEKRYETKE